MTDRARQISRERFVREVELLEILDGIFKIARRIARAELEPEAG